MKTLLSFFNLTLPEQRLHFSMEERNDELGRCDMVTVATSQPNISFLNARMETLLGQNPIVFLPVWGYSQNDSLPDLDAYFSAIIVNNMDTSLHWYSNTLGFEVLNKVVMEERGFQQANLKRGHTLIELIELNTALAPTDLLSDHPPKTKIMGFFKFGFLVAEVHRRI